MKNLILNSYLILLFACSSSYLDNFAIIEERTFKESELKAITSNNYENLKFIADVEAFGYSISGIIIIKKMDEDKFNIGFLNISGTVLIAFEMSKNTFHLIYCIEQFNNENSMKIIEDDLRTILFPNITKDKVNVLSDNGSGIKSFSFYDGKNDLYYYIDDSQQKLMGIDVTQDDELKMSVRFQYSHSDSMYNLHIKHYDYPLEIRLDELVDE